MNNQDNLIIYNTEDGKSQVALYVQDNDIWMTQNQLTELFATSVQNINNHILNILSDKELSEDSVIKYYLITAADGKKYQVKHYALPMILAIGFRVRSPRGVQFRRWANTHLQTYLHKGFVMDDERLKNPDGRPDYFDEMLARIRDIRASEKRFYQKVRDLLKLSSDYDSSDKATQMFFAEVQNKLLYAVTRQTAAELICQRADAQKANMGLTSWKGSQVRKGDIIVAKNYLNAQEIDTLNRLVVIFLEQAELRVKNRQDLTLTYWRNNVNQLLEFNDYPVLQGKGNCSNAQMLAHTATQYECFNQQRKQQQAIAADAEDTAILEETARLLEQRSKGENHEY